MRLQRTPRRLIPQAADLKLRALLRRILGLAPVSAKLRIWLRAPASTEILRKCARGVDVSSVNEASLRVYPRWVFEHFRALVVTSRLHESSKMVVTQTLFNLQGVTEFRRHDVRPQFSATWQFPSFGSTEETLTPDFTTLHPSAISSSPVGRATHCPMAS